MSARDQAAVFRSQAARAEIRTVWLHLICRNPFEHYTAREICRHLTRHKHLSERAVQWHMDQIRFDYESRIPPIA